MKVSSRQSVVYEGEFSIVLLETVYFSSSEMCVQVAISEDKNIYGKGSHPSPSRFTHLPLCPTPLYLDK